MKSEETSLFAHNIYRSFYMDYKMQEIFPERVVNCMSLCIEFTWNCKFRLKYFLYFKVDLNTSIYFILSSKINAYLKWIISSFVFVKKVFSGMYDTSLSEMSISFCWQFSLKRSETVVMNESDAPSLLCVTSICLSNEQFLNILEPKFTI